MHGANEMSTGAPVYLFVTVLQLYEFCIITIILCRVQPVCRIPVSFRLCPVCVCTSYAPR